jgi:tRNA(adenine34) deaminase
VVGVKVAASHDWWKRLEPSGADGAVVADGRSRRGETTGPTRTLAGSALAHAEINALAGLQPEHHPDKILRTTLQSCVACTAAAMMSHVGHVEYAGRDPLWDGLETMRRTPVLAERWVDQAGPLPGAAVEFAALIVLVEQLSSHPLGRAVHAYSVATPALLAAARSTCRSYPADVLRNLPLDEAVRILTPFLPCAAS